MIVNFEIHAKGSQNGKQYSCYINEVDDNNKKPIIFIDYCEEMNKKGDGKKLIDLKILSIDDKFGQPYLNESLSYEFLGHGKNKKITTLKYKAKKRNSVKKGFRGMYSKIRIIGIKKI